MKARTAEAVKPANRPAERPVLAQSHPKSRFARATRYDGPIAAVCWLAVIAASLSFAMPAFASGGSSVIGDCNSHNTLTHAYSMAELENALNTMPADVSEYTDCKDVITRALLIRQGNIKGNGNEPGSRSSSGSSFLSTPVIIVLVVLLLAAASFAALAIRKRRPPPDK